MKALDALCDLASTAIGKHAARGSSHEVAQLHSELMRTIRELGQKRITEAEAVKRAKSIRRRLSDAT